MTETQKMNLRSTIKALTNAQDRVLCKIAGDLGFEGVFSRTQINFEDPRINPDDKQKFQIISKKLYNATWELDKLENPEVHQARQFTYDLMNLLPLEDAVALLRDAGCNSTLDLVEKLTIKPDLIKELVL